MQLNHSFPLAPNQGDILEDIELIENLEETKRTALDIEDKVRQARATEGSISKAREVYRPVAARGSLVYFLIDGLNALDRWEGGLGAREGCKAFKWGWCGWWCAGRGVVGSEVRGRGFQRVLGFLGLAVGSWVGELRGQACCLELFSRTV